MTLCGITYMYIHLKAGYLFKEPGKNDRVIERRGGVVKELPISQTMNMHVLPMQVPMHPELWSTYNL